VGRPRLSVKAAKLDFGMMDARRTVTVANAGDGTLVYKISFAGSWMKADPASGTCTTRPQSIGLSADREGLKPGAYTGWLVIDAGAGGSVKIPVRMTAPNLAKLELIRVGNPWRYFKGKLAPPRGWNAPGFNDAAWPQGPTGIGYSTDIRLPTRLDDMLGKYVSVYARRKFRLTDPASVVKLTLGMVYDDGFIAYINGVEVARSRGMGAPGTPVKFNTVAKASHSEEAPEEFFAVKLRPGLLRTGENVLAVQVHNVYIKSSDLALIPRLQAVLVKSAAKPSR